MSFLKYLPAILKFRQVSTIYQEETGKDKPFYVSRRFIGAVITAIGAILSIYLGVKIDENLLSTLSDNVETLITAIVALYGLIMLIIGHIKRQE